MCVLTRTLIGAAVNERIAARVFSATCLFWLSTINTPSGPKSTMTRPPDASGCAGSRPSEPCSTKRFGDIRAVTMI
jgi:hypothetical protein